MTTQITILEGVQRLADCWGDVNGVCEHPDRGIGHNPDPQEDDPGDDLERVGGYIYCEKPGHEPARPEWYCEHCIGEKIEDLAELLIDPEEGSVPLLTNCDFLEYTSGETTIATMPVVRAYIRDHLSPPEGWRLPDYLPS